jgi:hypothetical protein
MATLNEKKTDVNTHKRLLLIVAVLCALVFAGVGGAVANYTIFRIDNGQWARIPGTNLFCQNVRSNTNVPSFQCTAFSGAAASYPIGSSYGLFVNQHEVVIERYSPNGRAYTGKNIYYHNP